MLKHNQHNGAQIQSNTLFLSYVQKIVSRIFSNIRATQGGCTSSSDKSTSSIRRNVPLGLVKNPALSGFIEMVKLYWTRSWNYSAETILLPWRLPGRQVSALAAHTQIPLRIQQFPNRLQYKHHPDSPPSRNNPPTSLQHSYLQANHLATSLLSPTFPTLLTHLSPLPVPACHLTPLFPTFPTLLPHLSPPPFPPCYLTPLSRICPTLPLRPTFVTLPPHLSPHLSHLATLPHLPTCHLTILLPFPLCHLTALPPFQPSQLTTFPPSQLVTLVLRDLTVAISITRNRISHNLTKAQPFPCNTNLRLQIPHTSNSPTPHIRNTPNVLTPFRQH